MASLEGGQTLHEIGCAFGKEHSSIRYLVSRHGGTAPAVRRRALLALTLREREEISRGPASGSSFREIAKCLERAVSTVSREVARHGGRRECVSQSVKRVHQLLPPQGIVPILFGMARKGIGGDDETRTRDLCRDCRYYNDLTDLRGLPNPRKSSKTSCFVGWVVGWTFAFPKTKKIGLCPEFGLFSSGWITSGLLVVRPGREGSHTIARLCAKVLGR